MADKVQEHKSMNPKFSGDSKKNLQATVVARGSQTITHRKQSDRQRKNAEPICGHDIDSIKSHFGIPK